MGKSLNEVAEELKNNNKKVQLIYAFNGTGKTRLSREFKNLVSPKDDNEGDETGLASKKILYYNAFTEDLFYWDNDLENDTDRKLIIRPNAFTKWVFEDQGQDGNVTDIFQHYTDEKLTPHFNAQYITKVDDKDITVPAFSEVTFTYERGNDEKSDNVKISKGEESCFIWGVFYSLLEQVIEVLNIDEDSIDQERETNQFDNLEYVFIDDPVSSLDDNHLIELAVQLAGLIKSSVSDQLKFVITTHNPIFYNVLSNDFNNPNKETGYKSNKHFLKHVLNKENDNYELNKTNDSPFSYHLFLLDEIKRAVDNDQICKYHFSFLRNVLEKTATFLGYSTWYDLLLPIEGSSKSYVKRILNFSSHSKHSAEEIVIITNNDKIVLKRLITEIYRIYRFKNEELAIVEEES